MINRQPYEFRFDSRLNIDKPILHVDYETLSETERAEFEAMCQKVCSRIPVQIQTFERTYMEHFETLAQVEEEEAFYVLLNEMNEISSCISDLNVLFLHIEGRFLASRVHA